MLQKDRMGTIPRRMQRTHKARMPSEMQYQHKHTSWGRRGGDYLNYLIFFRQNIHDSGIHTAGPENITVMLLT